MRMENGGTVILIYKNLRTMKKIILLVCVICLTQTSVNAQLYVDNDGYTVIGDPTYYEGVFNVISNEDPYYSLSYIYAGNNSCALELYNSPQTSNNFSNLYGISVSCESKPNKQSYGIRTITTGDASTTGRSYGILSKAGNSSPGWNYGVCTSLIGNNSGAGLYASSGSYPDGQNILGSWAGYFDGNVKVVGNLTATTLTQSSDYRLKENIRQLNGGFLDKVMEMNVVKYRLKNIEIDLGDTSKTVNNLYPDDSPILKVDHYGLIAQELKEIYPELVVEGEDGYLSVNYIELIPILIKSIQELKSQIEVLGRREEKVIQRNSMTTSIEEQSLQASLYQNDPNPFTEKTSIKCIIPNNVKSALLYIYDMNGRQIDSMTIQGRENVTITIEGNRLDAGMYMYSLVTDGNLVDTKRMILTK